MSTAYDGVRAAIARNLAIETKLAMLIRIAAKASHEWSRLSPDLEPYLEAAEAILKELREALPARSE